MLKRLLRIVPAAPVLELQEAADRFEIDTKDRLCNWLGQMAHESSGFTITRESLNYSVEALLSLFGRHRISEASARKYGRTATQKADQEALANFLYGCDWGRKNLGNTMPGDGWRFIGRGFKQLTGRTNYLNCGLGIGLDLIERPELLEKPRAAAMSAGWFWASRDLNELADRNDNEAITKRINGGLIGLSERKAWVDRFRAAL